MPAPRNNATRHAKCLLPPAGGLILLKQVVTGCSSMTTTAEPLSMDHYVKPIIIPKPKANNVFYCRQRRTEPRPQVTHMELSLINCS